MSDSRIPNQWQLKDTGESGDQWMLRDTEQRLPKNLQLQNDQSYVPPDAGWQPIDYRAMQQAAAPRARGGWLLGLLVFLALAAVAAYLTFYYIGAPAFLAPLFPSQTAADGSGGDGPAAAGAAEPQVGETAPISVTDTLSGTAAVTGTVPVTGAVPVTAGGALTAATTPEPVATPLPTPTPAPTIPPVLVRTATVSSGAGVNLRRNPLGTAELIRTLADNSSHVIASGPISGTDGGLWIQLALTDTLGYVSADYATIVTQTLPFSQAVTLLTSVGLPAPTPPVVPSSVATDTVEAAASDALTVTGALTSTASATTTEAATATAAVTVTSAATATDEATATSAGTAGVEGVSLPTPTRAAATTSPVTATATLTATPRAVATLRGLAAASNATATPRARVGTPTATAAAPITLTAVISPADGLNLRSNPDTSASVLVMLPVSTTVTLLARTENGQWLRARTATGEEGYLAASFVRVAGSVNRLPLDSEAGVGELLLPTATPRPGAVATVAPAVTQPEDSGLISGGPGTVTVSTVSGVNVRPAPSSSSSNIATLSWNATARALGRTADSQWVFVQLDNGTTGWVAAQAVVVADGMSSLTVLQ